MFIIFYFLAVYFNEYKIKSLKLLNNIFVNIVTFRETLSKKTSHSKIFIIRVFSL